MNRNADTRNILTVCCYKYCVSASVGNCAWWRKAT